MSRASKEQAALALSGAVLEAYKWEVIYRRSQAFARKSGNKAGTWGMFAWWAQQKFNYAVDNQDHAYHRYEAELLAPSEPE